MPRQPLPLGTWGSITRTELAAGQWQARARFRDHDGVTRGMKANGKTGAAAEKALKEAMSKRLRLTGADGITPNTPVAALAAAWLAELEESRDVLPQTIAKYRGTIDRYITPGLGSVRVSEATAGKLDKFLGTVNSDSTNKWCRVILTGMFSLATRRDAIAQNPVRETKPRKPEPRAVRALEVDEVRQFRIQIAEWSGGNKLGPARAQDLGDLLDVMLGTGLRIGEAVALQWPSIDLEEGTLTVTGTVVELEGLGLIRQAHPKTRAGHRTVLLPRFVVAALKRQQGRGYPSDTELVFPSHTGGLRAPNNVRRQLRDARGETFDWVTPHTLRKTTATIVDRTHGIGAAKDQLGHSSVAVTERHYVQRAAQAGDFRDALDELAPVSAPKTCPDGKNEKRSAAQ